MTEKKIMTRLLVTLRIRFKEIDLDDCDAFELLPEFCNLIFGFDRIQKIFFLQKIIKHPGNYYDPPTEDLVDLFAVKDFERAAFELAHFLVKEVLEFIELTDEREDFEDWHSYAGPLHGGKL